MSLGLPIRACVGFCLIVATATTPTLAVASTPITDMQASQQQSAQEPAKSTTTQSGADSNTSAPQAVQPAPAPDTTPATIPSPQSQPSSPVAPAQQPATPQAPLGTAAAPETNARGVSASTPAGAAIAPAKQKRVSRFSVRTALIVGAVVAVGIVVGLSVASPSKAGQ